MIAQIRTFPGALVKRMGGGGVREEGEEEEFEKNPQISESNFAIDISDILNNNVSTV